MIRLGITGGIGSGKSTISQLLMIYRIPVYIADVESKKLTESSPIIRDELIKAFGSSLYDDGKLNKKMLADIIFNDKKQLAKVNSIIHPQVDQHYLAWCKAKSEKYRLVGLESAILYESGMVKHTDKVLLVFADQKERIRRTILRDNSTQEKVLQRMSNQESDESKLQKADYILYNDEKHSLIEQTELILTNILR